MISPVAQIYMISPVAQTSMISPPQHRYTPRVGRTSPLLSCRRMLRPTLTTLGAALAAPPALHPSDLVAVHHPSSSCSTTCLLVRRQSPVQTSTHSQYSMTSPSSLPCSRYSLTLVVVLCTRSPRSAPRSTRFDAVARHLLAHLVHQDVHQDILTTPPIVHQDIHTTPPIVPQDIHTTPPTSSSQSMVTLIMILRRRLRLLSGVLRARTTGRIYHSISIMPSRSRFIQSSACTTCPIFSFAEVVVCFRRCSGCSPRGCPLTVRFRCSRTPQVHCVVDAVPFAQGSTCSSTAPLARRRSLHVDRVAVCAPSQCHAAPTSCCSPSSAAVVDAAPRV